MVRERSGPITASASGVGRCCDSATASPKEAETHLVRGSADDPRATDQPLAASGRWIADAAWPCRRARGPALERGPAADGAVRPVMVVVLAEDIELGLQLDEARRRRASCEPAL